MIRYILSSIIVLLLSCIGSGSFSSDIDMPASGDLWDNYGASQDFYGQDKKGVSDAEFDKAIEQVKDKQNRGFFGRKKKNKNIPKGEEFSQSNESEVLEVHSEKEVFPVVSLPVEIIVGDGILPVGHYQIQGERRGEDVILKFYQAHNLWAEFPAIETTDDYEEETITFARWIPDGENSLKIIYGSLDFNAYTIVKIKQ